MDNSWKIKKELTFTNIYAEISRLGEDYHILLSGGERPHIGCTVLAVPRPSLDGSGKMSSTASVLNVTGHKDEEVCRYLAEKVSAGKNAVVVCTGGAAHHRRHSHGRNHERTDCGNCGSYADNCSENRGKAMMSKGVVCLTIMKL